MDIRTVTIIAGSILVALILEAIGIASLIIYTENNYILNLNNTSLDVADSVNFLFGYGITTIIFGSLWIIFIIIKILYDLPAPSIKDNLYSLYITGQIFNVVFTIIIILLGFIFSLGFYLGFKNVKYEIWGIYLSIIILTPISLIACIVVAFINTCYPCIGLD